jgi:hypothetical protein
MLFSKVLHDSTIDNHKRVDCHPFVEMIRTDKVAGEMYINFNKMCIEVIQNNNKNEFIKELYRDTATCGKKSINPQLRLLLEKCENYPIEHGYMFFLGLLYGGNLLKRYLPDHSEFLTFEDPKDKIMRFKKMLDNIKLEDQDSFVNIVNESYGLIYDIFTIYNKQIR